MTCEDVNIPVAIKESLELTLSQHISNLAMTIPDFSNLRAKLRVRLRRCLISIELTCRKIFPNAITYIFYFILGAPFTSEYFDSSQTCSYQTYL